jgi:hypothetical protein
MSILAVLGAVSGVVGKVVDRAIPDASEANRLKNEIFKTWFKVSFRPVGRVTHEVYAAIKARRASIEEQMFAPYKAREEAEEKKPAKKRKF